jgi:hypothetical protein
VFLCFCVFFLMFIACTFDLFFCHNYVTVTFYGIAFLCYDVAFFIIFLSLNLNLLVIG